MIFWLSHKENQGDNQVKLTLDRRRLSVGQNVEMTVTARDAKGSSLTGLTYVTKVEREGLNPTSEPVELYNSGGRSEGLLLRLRPARRVQGHGDRPPGWPGGGPRLRPVPRLPGRSRAGEPLGRSRSWRGRSPRSPAARQSPMKALGKYLKGIDQSSLYRISQSDRAQDLGQLALPADLRHAADPGMVAAEAPRLGVEKRPAQPTSAPATVRE